MKPKRPSGKSRYQGQPTKDNSSERSFRGKNTSNREPRKFHSKNESTSSPRPRLKEGDREERKPFNSSSRPRLKEGDREERKPFNSSSRPRLKEGDREERKPFNSAKKEGATNRSRHTEKSDEGSQRKEKHFDKPEYKKKPFDKEKPFAKQSRESEHQNYDRRRYRDPKTPSVREVPEKRTFADQGLIRLNRYLANAGICSRREADTLITSGCITINGIKIIELGFKVRVTDLVLYEGSRVKSEKNVYLLLNKPKDCITTMEDELGRRTVMELVKNACGERIYPVGRLDRNTTGLLLFTNDGDMAKKLTHPKHQVRKLYHVTLDKNLTKEAFLSLQKGIELDDGFIKPDEVAYTGESRKEIGILIHSGRNRIVRRIFETLGYDVIRLDRTMFAGLTKKDLPRGKWRLLNEKEIGFLKMV